MELDDYFPAQFPKGREHQYYQKLKEQTILKLKQLLDPDDEKQKEIEKIDGFFQTLIDPKDFSRMEPVVELDFERMCHTMSEHTNRDIKRLTVKEFYALIDVIEKKSKNSKH